MAIDNRGRGPRSRSSLAFANPLGTICPPSITRSGDTVVLRVRARVDAVDAHIRFETPGGGRVSAFPGGFYLELVRRSVAYAFRESGWGIPDIHALRSVLFLAAMASGDEFVLEAEARSPAPGLVDVTATFRRQDGSQAARLGLTLRFDRPTSPARTKVDPAQLLAWLPYRHPMVLVDRVTDCEPGVSISTIKAVTAGEPCYRTLPDDSGPEGYAYPVSLMLTSFGQSAALLMQATASSGASGQAGPGVAYDGRLRNVRVRAAAFPGDILRHTVRLDKVLHNDFLMAGETWIDDRQAASVEVALFCRRPAEFLADRLVTQQERKDLV